jgi:hypothetical protein
MAVFRSRIRADQIDPDDSFEFAQVTIDGYSDGELDEGYKTGLIFKNGPDSSTNSLVLYADDGEIDQIGSGQVTFNGNVDMNNGLDVLGGNVYVANNTVIDGNLTVNGVETILNVESLVVEDPVEIFNSTGTEALTNWSGFSSRDTDGYNRFGWVFDGYWALSDAYSSTSQPDATPTRAVAFMGSGVTEGDLSDSGAAGRIGVTEQNGVTGTDVQDALENLATGSVGNTGTSNLNWAINNDAVAGTDENPCLIMSGGDGTSLIDGYLCLITDSVSGDRFEFKTYQDGSFTDSDVHINPSGTTSNIDATMTFNAGNGSDAYQASISLDGETGGLTYTAVDHIFSGDVNIQDDTDIDGTLNVDGATTLGSTLSVTGDATFSSDVDITGDLTVDGYATLGDTADDHIVVNGNIWSDLDPKDCSYQLGDTTHRWLDGYFCMFDPDNYTPIGSDDSLQGHLKGIDDALANVSLDQERGAYDITTAEATADELDTSRTVDQGDQTDVGSLTDAAFRDNIYIYLNGVLLYNDSASAADQASVSNDVARKTGSLSTLVFGGNINQNAVIQIVDLR